MSLHRNGFELRHHELKNADIDFFDQDEVVEKYYPECEKLLAEALVAKDGDADEDGCPEEDAPAAEAKTEAKVEAPAAAEAASVVT